MATQLGYACINMTLSKDGISANRRMIRRTFDARGIDYCSELILENLRALTKIVSWNNRNGIKVYRMSSDMFPWMSEYELSDLPDYTKICNLLTGIGKLAMDNNQRLSFHPGQFCVLASPTEKVVVNALNELNKSAQIMDLMGLPKSPAAKINIHVGGAYGDKYSALKRFCENFKRLQPSAQARLTVENDDKGNMYSVRDLFNGVYKVVGIPIVFDYHHHTFQTGDMTEKAALELAATTWPAGVKQCTHYSESKALHESNIKIRPQAHSDYISNYIDDHGLDIDIVVEAKAKELAVLNSLNLTKIIA